MSGSGEELVEHSNTILAITTSPKKSFQQALLGLKENPESLSPNRGS